MSDDGRELSPASIAASEVIGAMEEHGAVGVIVVVITARDDGAIGIEVGTADCALPPTMPRRAAEALIATANAINADVRRRIDEFGAASGFVRSDRGNRGQA